MQYVAITTIFAQFFGPAPDAVDVETAAVEP
jgi:hypothetical protein